ncbi:exocyst complex component EXO70E2 [Brachypodium distachyon]|uniref:exocyst complex component EXO70E2 n=1 Tax=Brachypodium distachyon TaxID=15368 RepID=UPI0001C740AC|nr:exocyst complex component EXO70E2 [Brachypodium distachyon]|eukprot:XP_010234976.1 exocyst complex component EXO70E2 [Brachypodium distachyon]
MAFPRSRASTVSSYASTPTLSSYPSSNISTPSSNISNPSPSAAAKRATKIFTGSSNPSSFATDAISSTGIRLIVPTGGSAGGPKFIEGKRLQQHQDVVESSSFPIEAVITTGVRLTGVAIGHNPELAATGGHVFTQGMKLQLHQDVLQSAHKFPKQETNGWAHPDLCSPSKQLKNVSTSIKEINRWARSSTTLKVNSNIRLLESVFHLTHVVTSMAPHPDHIVAMIRVHDALADLLLVLPKNIFPFMMQNVTPFVDELCPTRGASLSARYGNTLRGLTKSIRTGLQVLKVMILNYTSEAVPQGGGIHEITKYLLSYIMSLLEHRTSLRIILSDRQEGTVAMETLQDIVATLVSHLETMLEKESFRYQDAGLKQLFLVNNANFVLHQVKGSEIKYLLGDDWVLQHREQLKDNISRFVDISWESVMYSFHVKTSKIPIFSSLPTLKIFNLEFERIYWTQKMWTVENPLLRSDMRKSVSQKLVQAYRSYLEDHQNKVAKLVKYTPEDLEELLSELFEG